MSVSVSKGVSNVIVIADNVISGFTERRADRRDYGKSVTSDLLKGGLERFAHISASGNRASLRKTTAISSGSTSAYSVHLSSRLSPGDDVRP